MSKGSRAAAGFIKGWLEARDIAVEDHQYGEVFALTAEVGPAEGPTLVFHGHYDVVPGAPGAVHAAHPGRPARGPRRL